MFSLSVVLMFSCALSALSACGSRAVNSSITGVGDAAAGSWPWFADIRVDGGPRKINVGLGELPTSFGFGGSLINDQWVLTAASSMSL